MSTDEPITEYGQLMAGGGFHTFNLTPELEAIYPLADRIRAGQMHGGQVYRRRIIVVEEWSKLRKGAKR